MLLLALSLVLTAALRPAAAQPDTQVAFRAVLVKFDALADAETDPGRLRALEVERSRELARVLGEGLRFEAWQLVLTAAEATPLGGLFLRLHDSALDAPRSVRPTYWNSGPGIVRRETEIARDSPLRGPVALIKRGSIVVVSGAFFADPNGGPLYESPRTSGQELNVARARFRMPYFSIRLAEVDEFFPERRFP